MKKIYMKLFVGCLLCFGGEVIAQANLPLSRTAWGGGAPTGWTDYLTTQRTTLFACSGNDGGSLQTSTSYYRVNFNNAPATLTYNLKGSNPTTGSYKVQESTNGTTWTDVSAFTTIAGSTCQAQAHSLLSSSRFVQFIFITKTVGNIDIDDVNIQPPSSPSITPTPNLLSSLTYQVGFGPSPAQSFSISSTNLTAGGGTITFSGSSNYDVSTTSAIAGFGANATLGYTETGTLASNTVWVRLKAGLAIGAYNLETIGISGGGATASVTASGNVTAAIYTSVINGDWNVGTTWDKGSVPGSGDQVIIAAPHTVFTGISLSRSASTTVNGSFQVNGGGYASGTPFTYALTGSRLIMNHNSGLYGIATGQSFWPITNPPFNVTIQGTGAEIVNTVGAVAGTLMLSSELKNTAGITINGVLQISVGFFTGSPSLSPNFGPNSTLLYSTNYTVGNEWTGNNSTAGLGVPNNVTLQGSVSLPNSNRGMAGSLNITSGGLVLNAGSGDLYVAGNWTRASVASFTPNNRAVFFNGSTTQTVTVTATGTETFNYLIAAGFGTLRQATGTNITVNTSNGLGLLSSNGTSTIDLNGQTFTLSGGGNVDLNGGARKITSSIGGGNFNVTSANAVIINGGSVSFDVNTSVNLSLGINFGTGSLATIEGTLQLNANGFVQGNSPRYGSASLLRYNNGVIYGRSLEWTSSTPAIGTPANVQITNNTTLNHLNGTNLIPQNVTNNLTIDAGSSLYMENNGVLATCGGALSVAGNVTNAGILKLGAVILDDLKVGGNLILNSTGFNPNNRAVFFIGTGDQNITGTNTPYRFDYVVVNKSAGTVVLGANTTIEGPAVSSTALTLTNATDIFNLNGALLTLGKTGVISGITGNGSIRGSSTSDLTILGDGNFGTINFDQGTPGTTNLIRNFVQNRLNSGVITLGQDVIVGGTYTLTSGRLVLGSRHFTLNGVLSGTPSATNMVMADGAGEFRKGFTGSTSFTFPIGDDDGPGVEYTPATISFSVGSYAANSYVGMRLTDAVHPSNTIAVNRISRYWTTSVSGISGFTASGAFVYDNTDVEGSNESLIRTGKFDAGFWEIGALTNAASNTLSMSSVISMVGSSFTGGDAFSPVASSPSGYFRSAIVSGNWTSATSWESSYDNTTWFPATLAPTTSATSIVITTGNTIILTSMISVDKTAVSGTLQLLNNGSTNTGGITLVNGGATDELTINSGGMLQCIVSNSGAASDYSSRVIYNTNGNINVNEGGKITIGDGTASHIGKGYWAFGSDVASRVRWNNRSILEWNTTSVESIGTNASQVYFPGVAANVIPILRFSAQTAGTTGTTNPNVINGLLEINAPFTFFGFGAKTFRDGIIGTSTFTIDAGMGVPTISSATAVLGGASLTLVLNRQLTISNGITVPVGANVLVTGNTSGNIAKSSGSFLVNGTIDITDRTITNTTGDITVNGTLKTSRTNGFYNPGNIASGTLNLNNSSIIEYNALVDQAITTNVTYYSITFSGSGTKTPTSTNPVLVNVDGTVKISGTTNANFTNSNIGSSVVVNNTAFVMDGTGIFTLGTTGSGRALPWMDGTYTLTSGVLRYSGSGQTIRGKAYQNIEITGNDVANSSGNIDLNANGSFTIKTGGVFTSSNGNSSIVGATGDQTLAIESGGSFRCAVDSGFYGPAGGFGVSSPSVRNNIETITLNAGSTVQYARQTLVLPGSASSGNQKITIPISGGLPIAYQNLIFSGDGIKTAPSGTLTVQGNITKSGSSIFAPNDGLVLLNGTAQTFAGLPYSRLELSGGTKSTAGGGGSSIDSLLTINSSAILNIAAGDSISLLSTATRTARVPQLFHGTATSAIAYNVTGKFIVHRHIKSGAKWRYLSVPTDNTSQTFASAWREGALSGTANPKPGFGFLMGDPRSNWSALGFDLQTSRFPSIKTYVAASDTWVGIPSANGPMQTNIGYMTFIQGDRSINFPNTSSTILRTQGKLYVGNQPIITVPANTVISVGNPYPAPVNMVSVLNPASANGLVKAYQVWDPQATGIYGLGRYQILSWDNATSKYKVFPGGGSYDTLGSFHNFIESGQAFFIRGDATGGSIQFKESDKTGNATTVNFTAGNPQRIMALLKTGGSATDGAILDGVMTHYLLDRSDNVDGYDVHKLYNTGENVLIDHQDTLLVIEQRSEIVSTDTIHIRMSSMKAQAYKWEINSTNMDFPGRTGFFLDRYLNTSTPLNLAGSTIVNFTVANIPASFAADRFKIVFNQPDLGPVPVTITTVTASRRADKTIEVAWKVENELNISSYEVERSATGISFGSVHSRTSLGNNTAAVTYNHNDAQPLTGDNYYRIKATSIGGQVQYSAIVKVAAQKENAGISVYPNPVVGRDIQVRFTGQPVGKYQLQVSNAAGQVIYKNVVPVTSQTQSQQLSLPAGTLSGSYQLRVVDPVGVVTVQQVVIK